MLCRITGKVCTAWSETAGCGLVRCKFVEDKGGDEGMTDRRKDCPMRHENGNCTVAGGFCTAVNNPICEALHNAFDCGYRSALRQQDVADKDVGKMTNAQKIRAMSDEELCDLLDEWWCMGANNDKRLSYADERLAWLQMPAEDD